MCKSTDVWHFFDTCFCSFIYLYALPLLTVHARASLFNLIKTIQKERSALAKSNACQRLLISAKLRNIVDLSTLFQ